MIVRFKAVGSAPILVPGKQLGRVSSDQKFGTLLNHLRRQLKMRQNDALVLPSPFSSWDFADGAVSLRKFEFRTLS